MVIVALGQVIDVLPVAGHVAAAVSGMKDAVGEIAVDPVTVDAFPHQSVGFQRHLPQPRRELVAQPALELVLVLALTHPQHAAVAAAGAGADPVTFQQHHR